VRILLLTALAAGPALCQETRSRLVVPTVSVGPVTDGDLSDPAWEEAVVLRDLTQVQPVEGVPADPPTHILLVRTDEALHIAFECLEPEPEGMVVQDQRRDGGMSEDESVKVVLDPFSTGEEGVWFVVSAAGGRLDSLITENGDRLNTSWDGYWKGETRLHDDRWVAELELPFRGLTFPAGADVWRANFERYHGRRRAYYRWQGARRQFGVATISECGELAGFADVPPAAGISVVPFLTGRYLEDEVADARDSDLDFGGDVEWRVTPQLTASFSANTDFAETEADARVVNLSRFGVTFPEKRDFFLRDAELFEFGWESSVSGGAQLVPFRTRRIGLDADGAEVPLAAALRVAGRVGRLGLGQLGGQARGLDHELLVARPTWRVDEAWSAGALVTSGDPRADRASSTYGFDGTYSSSDGWPGLVRWDGFVLGSRDDDTAGSGEEGGLAWGTRASLRTAAWTTSLVAYESEEAFRPALGYVQRPGERYVGLSASYAPRPADLDSPVRNYSFGVSPFAWMEGGEMITSGTSATLFGVSWHDGSSASVTHGWFRDDLPTDFDPVTGVTIPAGAYDNHSLSLSYSTPRTRAWSAGLSGSLGDWYEGDRATLGTSLHWDPGPGFDLSLSVSVNEVSLPDGDFTTTVESLSSGWSLSPRLRVESLLQHDNVSDDIGLQGRLRFDQEDGRALYLVTNLAWHELPGGGLEDELADVILKLQYTWRF